jgi:endonuclease/exonuclease/phosphatase family metal-dependent hydrolase
LAIRIFYAALPFIALQKPLGRIITLTTDSIKSFTSLSNLAKKKDTKELLKTIIAISALVSTIFMHPLGLCISTLQDLGCDIATLLNQFQMCSNQEILYSLLSITQHLFYLGTMIAGSLEIIALSMLINMAIEACRSKKEFQKGNLLEGASHLLMSLVRFSQTVPYIEKIAYTHDIKGKNYSRTVNETMAKIRDHLAIHFFRSARFLVTPLWKFTETFLNTVSIYNNNESSTTTKVVSSTKSAFSLIVLLPFAVAGLALGQICHFSAYLLSTAPYIHLKSEAKEKSSDKNLSFFQLNCCLTSGGFSRWFGGTALPNDQRVLKIAEMIKEKNPDLVCLQEVSDINDAFNLYKELSSEYADFYLNMGPTPCIMQNNSGLFVASKVAIERPDLQSFSDIHGTEGAVNKCFFLFSTEKANFIITHLSPSNDDLNPKNSEIQTRSKEQERILLAANQRSDENSKPTFISGDFNINWNSEEYRESLLFNKGSDQYNKNRQEVTDQVSTAETEYLINQNWHHNKDTKPQRLILDYFLSFFQRDRPVSTKTIKISTFDVENPEKALSDHAALMTEINF